MTELSQKIFDTHQIRKSYKQKSDFIDLIKRHMPEAKIEQKNGLLKTRNILIGDPHNCKVILGAHYDTCAQLPFPNFIAPKSPLISILYSLLILIPIFAAVFVFNFVLNFFTTDYYLHYYLSLVLYCGMISLLLFGPANRHTANDNTSGVITLCEIYSSLSEEERQKVLFVFFDNEEYGLIGSSFFKKLHKQEAQSKLMLNFDCVSDGDNIMLAISKEAAEYNEESIKNSFCANSNKKIFFEKLEKIHYPSDQKAFKVAVAVAALNHSKFFGYYMDKIHTSRDTVFDVENIELLQNATYALIKAL